MRKLLLSLAIITVPFVLNGIASAQTTNDLSLAVSPAIFEVGGDPGQTVEGEITFQNTSDQAVAGFVVTDTLVPIDDIIDQAKRSQFDASSWLKLEETNLAFEPNSQQTVSFIVDIPEDANPGAHYALITLKPGVIQSTNTDTQISPELSASVFITVSGEINELAELIEEDLKLPNLTRGTSNDIEFRIRNVGNVHILPAPRVTISKDSEVLEIFALQPQLILPNTEKTFTINWDTNVDFGEYSVKAETTYGNESIPLASSQYKFLVLPNLIQIGLLIVFAPFLLFILIKWRNIPRTIAVLRGHANFSGKNYSRSPGDEKLTKPKKGIRTISEIAKEIEKTPSILGLPDTADDSFFEENKRETKAIPDVMPKKPGKKPDLISKTRVNEHEKTTFITQTSASTIVREKSPFFDPETEPTTPAKKIDVMHHDETKKKPTKKVAPKKKTSATKKKVTATKKTTKKAVKKTKPANKATKAKTKVTKQPAKKPVKKTTKKVKSTAKKATPKKKSSTTKKSTKK